MTSASTTRASGRLTTTCCSPRRKCGPIGAWRCSTATKAWKATGPSSGTPVPSRIAIASTDYIAADRVGVECMGINPAWPGYLNYCGQLGLGNYDIARIDVIGAKIADVQKKYQMHADIERELQWMGEMKDLPIKLG